MPASSRAVLGPSGTPLPSRRWPRSASAATGTQSHPWPGDTPAGQGQGQALALGRNFHPSPVKYLLVARRNGSSPECGFGLAVTAASCNHLQPLECMGEIGEIYLFIVVICRQWVFLMRNICFCVFPENIIPLWKWYSHPFQQHRKENMGLFLSFICFSLGQSNFPGTLFLWHLFTDCAAIYGGFVL